MRLELPKERLVIPSGTVASTADIIRRLADVEDLGVITTKSIGLSERDGYKEPIMAGVAGSLVNAVGLANPGVDAYLEEIKQAHPLKKILMTSIFGGTPKEFAELAERVERHTDWIELNLSCPHAEGYGAAIGNRLDLVTEVVLAVRGSTDLPIFVKVVPSQGSAGLVAKRAVDKGADGITAVNTLGPLAFLDETAGRPLLSNVLGGLSGIALKDIAIRCVREVRERVTVPIIGMGGIYSRSDLDAFRSAGASLFGVGTALAGMNTEAIGAYFRSLLCNDPVNDRAPVMPTLGYKALQVKEAWGNSAMRVLVLDGAMKAMPGQFIFLWLPGIGEKPFSLASRSPIMVLIKSLGVVSSAFANLEEGSTLFIRGPYGNGYSPSDKVGLVGGGSGVAPIHFIASEFGEMTEAALIGGRNSSELPLYDNLRSHVETRATTEDGSLGARGLVTDILDTNRLDAKEFFNCGPEPMLVRAAEMECAIANASRIYCAVERYTKCGIGLCGSCAMDGFRICVDGPVFPYSILRNGKDFGRFKRRVSGRRVPLNA
jgi:dihydroorotate dehydrogenase (NAD+) catalytic subunit